MEFLTTIASFKSGGIEPRTTYSLAGLFNNVSNAIQYEYNHPATFNNVKFQFIDTISIVDANNAYTVAQATAVYDSVLYTCNQQALRIGSSGVYLISVVPRVISSIANTHQVEISGTYVNSTPAFQSAYDTIFMPDDRWFGRHFDCGTDYDIDVPGAGTYLTRWLIRQLMYYGISANMYFVNTISVTNAFSCTLDSWSVDSLSHFSQSFKWNLLTLNPDDYIPRDGSRDYLTFGYHYKKGDSDFFLEGGCIPPEDLSFYAPNVKTEVLNQQTIHFKDAMTGMYYVNDGYQVDCSSQDSMMGSWQFRIFFSDIMFDVDPLPQKDITSPY